MWVKKEFPVIRGYEELGDHGDAKRWLSFKPSQLLDSGASLWECKGILNSRQKVCDFVISQFKYPMRRGVPTDRHENNWFSGLCCHKISMDYFQQASETLRTLRLNGDKGMGDCEDVAILATTLMLMQRWPAQVVFGAVLRNGEIQGYHAWGVFRDQEGRWRLYEATLTTPPSYPDGYPVVSLGKTEEWQVGNITYRGYARFDRKQWFESDKYDIHQLFHKSKREKDTRAKFQAIAEAWHQPTKPEVQAGLMGKIRWR